jgi:hypothetical protein
MPYSNYHNLPDPAEGKTRRLPSMTKLPNDQGTLGHALPKTIAFSLFD